MAAPRVRPNEVRFAYLLLQYLHSNAKNAYLLLAVIAWIRAEGGTTGRYAGNNPLNLFLSGRRATFANLNSAARATARQLLSQPEYRMLVTIFRRGAADAKGMATQAQDVLQALALSNWNKNHYGAGHWVVQTVPVTLHSFREVATWVFDASKNTLLAIWMKLLGAKITIPADVLPQPKPPSPAPPPPRRPAYLLPTHYQPNYIQPYAAQQFLDARWKPLVPLGDA